LSWRLALALLSALPIIAIAMVLQVSLLPTPITPIIVSSCPKAMVFSVYSRSCASALAAAAAFADTLLGNCVLIRASGKQERETLHYSDLVSQVEIQQRRQALFAGT
jgi:hypothetical protein